MRVMTRKDLELGLVSCAERFPNRVGARGRLTDEKGDHCILGQIIRDFTGENHQTWCCVPHDRSMAFQGLTFKAAQLNNAGHKWGLIPKMLGLVPGEQPAQPIVTEPALEPVEIA